MNTKTIVKNGKSCAIVHSGEVIISDVRSALDFIATVQYETGCSSIALNKEAFAQDFFILSTRLAGEILQKFVQYHVRLAIIGDFSVYTSKPLHDFIYESNQGNHIFFAADENQAAELLAR